MREQQQRRLINSAPPRLDAQSKTRLLYQILQLFNLSVEWSALDNPQLYGLILYPTRTLILNTTRPYDPERRFPSTLTGVQRHLILAMASFFLGTSDAYGAPTVVGPVGYIWRGCWTNIAEAEKWEQCLLIAEHMS